jgi:hypothetical protein
LDWVSQSLSDDHPPARQACWTESVAVGSEQFVKQLKAQLGERASYRTVARNSEEVFLIRDAE